MTIEDAVQTLQSAAEADELAPEVAQALYVLTAFMSCVGEVVDLDEIAAAFDAEYTVIN